MALRGFWGSKVSPGGVGGGVEVTAHDHVCRIAVDQLLDAADHGQGLQFPFVLGPPGPGVAVAGDQQPPERLGCRHLGDDGAAAVVAGPWREVEVDLVDGEDRPAAGHRSSVVAAVAEQPTGLVDDLVVPAEQLDGLVVGVVGDGLLQGQDVGPQPGQSGLQDLASCRPVSVVPEQVQAHRPQGGRWWRGWVVMNRGSSVAAGQAQVPMGRGGSWRSAKTPKWSLAQTPSTGWSRTRWHLVTSRAGPWGPQRTMT
jgi:hypothetical protein